MTAEDHDLLVKINQQLENIEKDVAGLWDKFDGLEGRFVTRREFVAYGTVGTVLVGLIVFLLTSVIPS